MPSVEEWEKKVEEFFGEISNDDDLNDHDFLEVLENIESLADSSIRAKREEMDDDD